MYQSKIFSRNCQSFLFQGSDLFSINKNEQVLYKNGELHHNIEKIVPYGLLGLNENNIVIKNDRSSFIVLNYDTFEENKILDDFEIRILRVFCGNYITFCKMKPVKTYGIFDFNKNKIIIQPNENISEDYIFNTLIISTNTQFFEVFDFEKNISWKFSVTDFPNYLNGFYREQKADIKQIIGMYNNILWVHVGGFRLVGIDVKIGKQTNYIEDMAYHLGLTKEERRHFDFASYGNSIHLDENTGILKAFAHRYYIEIDLKNLQGKVKKDFGEDWRTSWRIKNSIYYQKYSDLLFFSGYYKNMDKQPNGFGVFDTGKSEILWYDTHKNDGGYFYTPPQANDKLLAILDDKYNLLVYNREDII
jgi:hypothetical protein